MSNSATRKPLSRPAQQSWTRRRLQVAAAAAAIVLAAALGQIVGTQAAFQDPGSVVGSLGSYPQSLIAVGDNNAGVLGMGSAGGTRSTYQKSDPQRRIPGEITSASSSDAHACVVSEGKVFCWGANAEGQLGIGTTTPTYVPTQVSPNPGDPLYGKTAIAVSTGYIATNSRQFNSTCASVRTALGGMEIYCWGDNDEGHLGDGTRTDRHTPVRVSAIPFTSSSVVSSLSLGYRYTCAVVDGQAWCWGENNTGELGVGNTTGRLVPTLVTGEASFTTAQQNRTVTAISASGDGTCAIAGGAGYCWGRQSFGALGNGTTSDGTITQARPVAKGGSSAIPVGATLTSIGTMFNGACALAQSGEVYCWGNNSQGQNGRGAVGGSDAGNPVKVTQLTHPVIALGVIRESACALYSTHQLACWGDNRLGQLGRGNTSSSGTPALVTSLPSNRPIKSVSSGSGISFLVTQGWG